MPVIDNHIPTRGIDAQGDLIPSLEGRRWDPGLYRPFIDNKYNRPCVIVNTGKWTVEKGQRVPLRQARRVVDLLNDGYINPVLLMANAYAIRPEVWIQTDKQMREIARPRLRAWGDLEAAAPYGGFDGMAKLTLEYEAMGDSGVAVVDMDAIAEGRADTPLISLRSVPLPITHSDYYYTQRTLAVSGADGGMPLDNRQGRNSTRKVAEMVEDTLIGLKTGINYGGVTLGPRAHDTTAGKYTGVNLASKVYGYLTYPHRIIKSDLTAPTDPTWHPQLFFTQVLACRDLLYQANHFGPFMIYTSTDWDATLDNVFFFNQGGGGGNAVNLAPSTTLRNAIRTIDGIQDIRRLDRLTPASGHPHTLIFVEMTDQTAQAVTGMPLTTIQWPTKGGLMVNYKVMCIKVGRFYSDALGQAGLLEATAA